MKHIHKTFLSKVVCDSVICFFVQMKVTVVDCCLKISLIIMVINLTVHTYYADNSNTIKCYAHTMCSVHLLA